MGKLEKMLKAKIRSIPDYPKKGILFRDITPLLKSPKAFKECVDRLAAAFAKEKVDYVVGIEARGFIIGVAVAQVLGVGFVPIRKEGKLPYKKISKSYELEYGRATIEMHQDGVERGKRVVVIDDLLATGGTSQAAGELLESVGAKIAGFGFVVELKDLNGRKKLKGKKIVSLVKY